MAGKESMAEIQLLIWGNTLTYRSNNNGKLQAQVEIVETIHQNDKIVTFKKFNLESEERTVMTDLVPDLVDIRNFNLPKGQYLIEVMVKDLNLKNSQPIIAKDSIEIKNLHDSIFYSDIQIIKELKKSTSVTNFTKSGYEAIPKFSPIFTLDDSQLIFYTEVYNLTNQYPTKEPLLLKYHLKTTEGKIIPAAAKFKKIKSENVVAILDKLPLASVDPGVYHLEIAIHNQANEKISETNTTIQILDYPPKITHTDHFPMDSINGDSISEFIHWLEPIASSNEKEIIKTISNLDSIPQKKLFLIDFWIKRNPTTPYDAWNIYKRAVNKCNRLYGTTIKEGVETDQGYVFLKYGSPNSVSKRDKEPNAYPYEIWHYYKAGNYNNKQFIFYNPNLNLNDYLLLHSDVPGEIKDSKWQLRIQNRTNPLDEIDQTKGIKNYGGQIEEFHELPK